MREGSHVAQRGSVLPAWCQARMREQIAPLLDPLLRDALIYSIMPHCNARLNV